MKKKGQYFSLDVITAVIIFIFAFYLLLNYWNGVSSQLNEEKSFMYSEALRLSEILLTVGDYYNSYPAGWILSPDNAFKAGLATNDSPNKLVYYPSGSLSLLYNGASITYLKEYTNPTDQNYIKYKNLLGTPLDFYVEIYLFKPENIGTISIYPKPPDTVIKFGLTKNNIPPSGADVYKVRRIVYTSYKTIRILNPMIGYMDVYVWNSNQKIP